MFFTMMMTLTTETSATVVVAVIWEQSIFSIVALPRELLLEQRQKSMTGNVRGTRTMSK